MKTNSEAIASAFQTLSQVNYLHPHYRLRVGRVKRLGSGNPVLWSAPPLIGAGRWGSFDLSSFCGLSCKTGLLKVQTHMWLMWHIAGAIKIVFFTTTKSAMCSGRGWLRKMTVTPHIQDEPPPISHKGISDGHQASIQGEALGVPDARLRSPSGTHILPSGFFQSPSPFSSGTLSYEWLGGDSMQHSYGKWDLCSDN